MAGTSTCARSAAVPVERLFFNNSELADGRSPKGCVLGLRGSLKAHHHRDLSDGHPLRIRRGPLGHNYIVMAYIVMAYILTAYILTAYILTAYIVTAYIVMAYI